MKYRGLAVALFVAFFILRIPLSQINVPLFETEGVVQAEEYTESQKAQAKAWLSAHGYSPTRAGASQAYSDYLSGKLKLSASEEARLGLQSSHTEEKGEKKHTKAKSKKKKVRETATPPETVAPSETAAPSETPKKANVKSETMTPVDDKKSTKKTMSSEGTEKKEAPRTTDGPTPEATIEAITTPSPVTVDNGENGTISYLIAIGAGVGIAGVLIAVVRRRRK
ncbi:hypothetical protein [Eubacterium xylanophilum]|uniref:hypothetical protein n=1 Tax=Eubacterium xylanophilum TaxID=39497 RepID=UPI00047BEA9F|nr:hypothetical protein [Eubacterium xylanophilum]